jgi:hypothetical protein
MVTGEEAKGDGEVGGGSKGRERGGEGARAMERDDDLSHPINLVVPLPQSTLEETIN